MTISIGADHRGFEHKQSLAVWLKTESHTIVDLGNTMYQQDDDYPDYAFTVGEHVAQNKSEFGIVLCGSSVGVTVAANKVIGVRCFAACSKEQVQHARSNDDCNVLALAADVQSVEECKTLIRVFLQEPFSNKERHKRRIDKIAIYENK